MTSATQTERRSLDLGRDSSYRVRMNSNDLNRLIAEADSAAAELQAMASPLSDDQLCWRPGTRSWSIAEILTHLRLTAEQCIPSVDKALAQARSNNITSAGPFRLTLMGRFFVWYCEPPPAIRLPAPRTLVPSLDVPPGQALPRFLQSQASVIERIVAADGLDLNRARFRSPFASFVTMDLLACFSVFTAHERRHIWQAGNVLKQMHTSKVRL